MHRSADLLPMIKSLWEKDDVEKPDFHIFVCNSFRVGGEPQGTCCRKGASDLIPYVEEEIVDRGLDAMVSSTGCLKICDQGPVMVIYPGGWWYTELTEEKIDAVLDALEEGQPAASARLA
ncbi:MAG: (2Fe-2S) ferredoxin domain-containing protein [Planctomycetota bacterium]